MISKTVVEKPSVPWPGANVEIWPIERITANLRNARIHSPEQIEQIRASLREFGWTMPVLVRENGMLIAGHGRLARISHTTECIRAANQRKSLCCNIFSSIRGAPRCRQSVARICLDLHPLKDAKW